PWLYQFLPNNIELRIDRFLGNVTMSINTLYPIEREILSGMYEKHTVNVINIFVSKGDFCLYIGANIGAISFALAQRVGMHGTVMCFEPGPTPYYRFIDNLSLNPRLRRIIVPQQIGFSDSPGTMFWNEFEHNPGDANLTQTPLWNSVPVSVTTIDDYFEKHPIKRLNFVKIDVGNMASDVFKGGMNTWKKFTPIFYYETPQADTEPVCAAHAREIQCMLSSLGYSFYTLREDNTLLPARYPHYAVNTLALTDRQLYI
ncbi:MAG TPA: FkbM family methyltransferase, partial [Chitinivibrionales bacterium]